MTPEMEELLQQMLADAAPEDQDDLARSIEQLRTLPPELQAEAVGELTKDYEGRETTLRDELENNYALLNQEGPQGEVAGNNQFSIYVGASPLEHLASGLQKFDAGKQVKASRAGLEGLSKSKEAGLGRVAQGMLTVDPEEERRRKLQRMLALGLRGA